MLDHFKCVETTGIGQRLLVVEIGHVGIGFMLDKKVKNADIWIHGRFVNAEVVFGRSIAPCFLPMWQCGIGTLVEQSANLFKRPFSACLEKGVIDWTGRERLLLHGG